MATPHSAASTLSLSRRSALRQSWQWASVAAVGGAMPLLATQAAHAVTPVRVPALTVQVWKDPQCGCCEDWLTHLQANGFKTTVEAGTNTEARKRWGMPDALASCHTARVGGYTLEGHVPAQDIRKLLQQKPKAVGLTVPGMPIGSPGMDSPAYQGRRDAFDVLLVQADGSSRVFSHYAGNTSAAPHKHS